MKTGDKAAAATATTKKGDDGLQGIAVSKGDVLLVASSRPGWACLLFLQVSSPRPVWAIPVHWPPPPPPLPPATTEQDREHGVLLTPCWHATRIRAEAVEGGLFVRGFICKVRLPAATSKLLGNELWSRAGFPSLVFLWPNPIPLDVAAKPHEH